MSNPVPQLAGSNWMNCNFETGRVPLILLCRASSHLRSSCLHWLDQHALVRLPNQFRWVDVPCSWSSIKQINITPCEKWRDVLCAGSMVPDLHLQTHAHKSAHEHARTIVPQNLCMRVSVTIKCIALLQFHGMSH